MWPRTGRTQTSSAKVVRIGFLGLPSADSLPKRTEAFRAGLRDLGYQEGRDIVIEYRWADSKYDRLPALLAELINLNVDLIVTHGTPGGHGRQAGHLNDSDRDRGGRRCGGVGVGGEPCAAGRKRNRVDVFSARVERETA
jgi:hypothetical protein